MFKKSRKKIVASIMSVLVLLWVGTLSIIYISSYLDMSKRNKQMLKEHSDMYTLPPSLNNMYAPNSDSPRPAPKFADSHMFQLSTFYTVAVSYDGKVLEVKNDEPTIYTDSELKKLAKNIIKDSKRNGTEDNLVFYKADKGGYILVTFMDNTVINENALTLFHHTLMFGGVALVMFFFLSIYLAKKIVRPLEESYQKQKQFISDAGHELKTPITVVSANAELLSRELKDNKWLSNIQYENERMGMLVNQLLELARTENSNLQMEHINFSRLVDGETLPFESVAFENGLIINSKIESDIMVEGNSIQLKQLVSILLDNAISHSHDDGEVSVSLVKEHGFAKLSVINKGDEIPKEQREEIFERFYRMDSVRNSESNHYGLGLAIAKAIVLSHKGHIKVLCYNGLIEFIIQIPFH